jgi:hypothetical protein
MALPAPGIYFRKASMNDRLLDGLITLRVSVAIITPLGVEEKEIVITGSDILTAVQALLSLISNYAILSGLPLAPSLGGPMQAPATAPAGDDGLPF